MALLVSHNCLSAIDWFPYKGRLFDKTEEHQYNDIIRAYYDELYKLNVEVDIIELGTKKLNNYQFIIAPSLYSISDEDLITLNDYVKMVELFYILSVLDLVMKMQKFVHVFNLVSYQKPVE